MVTQGFDTLVRLNKGLVATSRRHRNNKLAMDKAVLALIDTAQPTQGQELITFTVPVSVIRGLHQAYLKGQES